MGVDGPFIKPLVTGSNIDARQANIESSPVWDTSCLSELIFDLIYRQFLCVKCPKSVTIQYLHTSAVIDEKHRREIHPVTGDNIPDLVLAFQSQNRHQSVHVLGLWCV